MILETLSIIFKGDTSDLKKKRIEAEKQTDLVNKKLSSTKKAADNIGESLGNVAKQFAGVALSALSLSAIMGDFKRVFTDSIGLAQFGRNTETNVGQLEAWGQAIRRVGGSAEGFKASIMGLSQVTGGSPQTALNLLPTFSQMFSKFNYMQGRLIAQSFNIDDSLYALLRQPKLLAEVYASVSRLGVVINKSAPDLLKFNSAWLELDTSMRLFFLNVQADALPGLTAIVRGFNEFFTAITANKAQAEGALYGIGVALTALGAAFIGIKNILRATEIGAIITLFGLFGAEIQGINTNTNTWLDDMVVRLANAVPLLGKLLYTIGEIETKIGKTVGGALYDYVHGNSSITGGVRNYAIENSPNFRARLAENGGGLYDLIRQRNTFGAGNQMSVQINEVNVNTQATDAAGISVDIGKTLRDNLLQLTNHYNNGRLA